MTISEIRTALIVDNVPGQDDAWSALEALGVERVECVGGASAALQRLDGGVDLLLLEASLPDAGALQVIARARGLRRPPIIVVMGEATPGRLVAELMAGGADSYAERPLLAEQLGPQLERLTDGEALCQQLARLLVGRVGLKEAQYHLRGTMNTEALVRTRGSRRAAADLLGVDRRYVQHMVAEFGAPKAASALASDA